MQDNKVSGEREEGKGSQIIKIEEERLSRHLGGWPQDTIHGGEARGCSKFCVNDPIEAVQGLRKEIDIEQKGHLV